MKILRNFCTQKASSVTWFILARAQFSYTPKNAHFSAATYDKTVWRKNFTQKFFPFTGEKKKKKKIKLISVDWDSFVYLARVFFSGWWRRKKKTFNKAWLSHCCIWGEYVKDLLLIISFALVKRRSFLFLHIFHPLGLIPLLRTFKQVHSHQYLQKKWEIK